MFTILSNTHTNLLTYPTFRNKKPHINVIIMIKIHVIMNMHFNHNHNMFWYS